MMSRIVEVRTLLLRLALVLLFVGAGVFLSPLAVRSLIASEPTVTCTATCPGGGCVAYGSNCTCSCSFWTQTAACRCTEPVEKAEQTNG